MVDSFITKNLGDVYLIIVWVCVDIFVNRIKIFYILMKLLFRAIVIKSNCIFIHTVSVKI